MLPSSRFREKCQLLRVSSTCCPQRYSKIVRTIRSDLAICHTGLPLRHDQELGEDLKCVHVDDSKLGEMSKSYLTARALDDHNHTVIILIIYL